jgi:hypothetical protein
MIEAAFNAPLISLASRASLLEAREKATGVAAIARPPVTMGADEEHGAAIDRCAELLVEDEVVVRRHPGLGGGLWTSGAQ